MTDSDYKVFLLNTASLGLSMAEIEIGLKIFLLTISIGYTLNRWYELRKNKDERAD